MRAIVLTLLFAVISTAALASPARLHVREVSSNYGALESLSDLWALLKRAAEIGNDELRKALDDPRVDALLQRLTGFARKSALKAVQYFKSLLEKPDPMSLMPSYSPPVAEDLSDEMVVVSIYALIFEAKQSGKDELKQVLESDVLSFLIDQIVSLELKVFLLGAVEELKTTDNEEILPISADSSSEVKPIFSSYQAELEIVKEIWHALNVAAGAGKDTLLRVLNDPQIRESVNNLGYFARKSALKILSYFESKLSDEPQPISDESPLPTLQDLYNLLDKARIEGMVALKNILESKELEQLVDNLPTRYLPMAKAYIRGFAKLLQYWLEEDKVLSMIAVAESSDGTSEDDDEQAADLLAYVSTLAPIDEQEKITTSQVIQTIRRYIEQSAKEGKEKLKEALSSENIQALLKKLPLSAQVFINKWLSIYRGVLEE